MATNAQVIAAINSLVSAVQAAPAGGGGVTAEYVEVGSVTPLWTPVMSTITNTSDGTSATIQTSANVVGLTAKLPKIINPRDIIVVNGVMTVRITQKKSLTSTQLSADTVIPVTITCVPAGDGVSLRTALPQVTSNVPAGGYSFISATLVSWTPVATARYSM